VININLKGEWWIDYLSKMIGNLLINFDSVNNIGDEGAKFIAAVFEKNQTVTNIDLRGQY
jgi:hypothetical protein